MCEKHTRTYSFSVFLKSVEDYVNEKEKNGSVNSNEGNV